MCSWRFRNQHISAPQASWALGFKGTWKAANWVVQSKTGSVPDSDYDAALLLGPCKWAKPAVMEVLAVGRIHTCLLPNSSCCVFLGSCRKGKAIHGISQELGMCQVMKRHKDKPEPKDASGKLFEQTSKILYAMANTVNLNGSRITCNINLWACAWRNFETGLTVVRRPTLSIGRSISWSKAPDYIEWGEWAGTEFISLCFLTVDSVWPAVFPTMMDYILELWVKINTSFLKLLFLGTSLPQW